MSNPRRFQKPSSLSNTFIIIIFQSSFFVTIGHKISTAGDVYSEDGIAKCETFVYDPDTNQLECSRLTDVSNHNYGDIDSEILDIAPLFFITFVLAVFGIILLIKLISWCRATLKRRRDSSVETYQQFECPEPTGLNTVGNNIGFTNPSYDGVTINLSTPDVITSSNYQDAPPPDYQSPPPYNQCMVDGNDSHNQSTSDRTRII